ncbi:MAG: hypothetical protein MUE42_01895 [Opitutaceae bacterium]|nr:hypothetical protein [Opitutaceae bacterium]
MRGRQIAVHLQHPAQAQPRKLGPQRLPLRLRAHTGQAKKASAHRARGHPGASKGLDHRALHFRDRRSHAHRLPVARPGFAPPPHAAIARDDDRPRLGAARIHPEEKVHAPRKHLRVCLASPDVRAGAWPSLTHLRLT